MKTLDRMLKRALDPKIRPVSIEVEVKVSGNLATATAVVSSAPTIDLMCGAILGDTLQNFRAALDHLAWTLVKNGTTPKPKRPDWVYFPMARTERSFKRRVDEWLPGVKRRYRAIIRRYQPYHRSQPARAMRLLRDLSDEDKHRVLVPTVLNKAAMSLSLRSNWTPVATRHRPLARRFETLEVGTKLMTAKLHRSGRGECAVQVEGYVIPYPSLGGGGLPVMDWLGQVRTTVRTILEEFAGL